MLLLQGFPAAALQGGTVGPRGQQRTRRTCGSCRAMEQDPWLVEEANRQRERVQQQLEQISESLQARASSAWQSTVQQAGSWDSATLGRRWEREQQRLQEIAAVAQRRMEQRAQTRGRLDPDVMALRSGLGRMAALAQDVQDRCALLNSAARFSARYRLSPCWRCLGAPCRIKRDYDPELFQALWAEFLAEEEQAVQQEQSEQAGVTAQGPQPATGPLPPAGGVAVSAPAPASAAQSSASASAPAPSKVGPQQPSPTTAGARTAAAAAAAPAPSQAQPQHRGPAPQQQPARQPSPQQRQPPPPQRPPQQQQQQGPPPPATPAAATQRPPPSSWAPPPQQPVSYAPPTPSSPPSYRAAPAAGVPSAAAAAAPPGTPAVEAPGQEEPDPWAQMDARVIGWTCAGQRPSSSASAPQRLKPRPPVFRPLRPGGGGGLWSRGP